MDLTRYPGGDVSTCITSWSPVPRSCRPGGLRGGPLSALPGDLAGVLAAALGPLGPTWLLGTAAVLTALMALMARARLRGLRS